MMITTFLLTISLQTNMATMQTEWVDQAELCKLSGKEPGCMLPVTSAGFGVKWIGEVTAMQFLPEGDPTGYVKVRITWYSSETTYECGREYMFHMDELKDVTARSVIVKRCS